MVSPTSDGYTEVRVYIEGGGTYRGDRRPLREAFTKLLGGVVGDRPKPRMIACGGRGNAFAEFQVALRSNKDALCLLLVDSEGPVTPGTDPWTHVKERRGDLWERPAAVEENQLHFMVQMMEAWIVADVEALSRYYGKGFDAKALPYERLEDVSKDDLEKKLTKATKTTSKKGYEKSDGMVLIGCVAPSRVENACAYARRFFDRLREACAALPRPRSARRPGA